MKDEGASQLHAIRLTRYSILRLLYGPAFAVGLAPLVTLQTCHEAHEQEDDNSLMLP